MVFLIGKSLGRYRILEEIGEGGMATVYKAYDTRLEIEVAVKVMRTERVMPEMLSKMMVRFEREAKSIARLTHPNIVKVTDYGEQQGLPFLVMEYLTGSTLKSRMGWQMPWKDAFRLARPIAEALEYAHAHDIIHRDVKPSNILFTDSGAPILTDFGIAKILDIAEGQQTLTGTGVGLGTPEYMAPEQWVGNATAASDQYSLGVVLFELITGKTPYTAETPAAILIQQTTQAVPSPRSMVAGLPENVHKFLLKALAKEPNERFSSMSEFRQTLEKIKAGGSPTFEMPAARVSPQREPVGTASRTQEDDATILKPGRENKEDTILHPKTEKPVNVPWEKVYKPEAAPKPREDDAASLRGSRERIEDEIPHSKAEKAANVPWEKVYKPLDAKYQHEQPRETKKSSGNLFADQKPATHKGKPQSKRDSKGNLFDSQSIRKEYTKLNGNLKFGIGSFLVLMAGVCVIDMLRIPEYLILVGLLMSIPATLGFYEFNRIRKIRGFGVTKIVPLFLGLVSSAVVIWALVNALS